MFDKLKMLQQAHALQSKMQAMNFLHEEKGIKIAINGKQDVQSIEITDANLLQDKESLERSLCSAVNGAISKSQREAALSMSSELGGLF
ncbi:hypothetical protein A2482_05445 [Candidatus Falkowbacteria bacterium RIFOXYC2_FULL_48_21]|uniref:Nucleoid-associated protein, YbaB/EbfC family n=1 Tax=Candidatus Falkowbacteria bacterium RIFOXYC2_FULL_48_21 TaxID=1798005 RepID=A0A1F5TH95_9BACT|nr:MAG: hypothetical protein A2482_05445 [Candidatus Falkowbacteria bacterium RIFOXYC2_FULL_48_21]